MKKQINKTVFKKAATTWLIPSLLLTSFVVRAGNINFDFRYESDSSSYNTAAKAASASNVSATNLKMKTGRVDFKGKVNEDLSYRLRWRFDKDYGTSSNMTSNNKTDGFTNHVDYAYLAHKLLPELTMTLGKFGSEIGGFEGNTPASDIYLQSQVYAKILPSFIYVSGGKLSYNLGQHDMSLLVLNQSETNTAEQSKLTYGLTYKAQFLENKEMTLLLSYLNDEKQSLTDDAKKMTGVTSIGIKYEPKPYYLSIDYLIFEQKNQTVKDNKDNWNSIVADFGYDFDGIQPKFKYEISQYKAETAGVSTTTKYDGVTLGLEYKPIHQENFRYHMMVTQLTTKPAAGDSLFEQHFIVGTKITADFLK